MTPENRRDLATLREGYTRGVFLLEVSSIIGFTAVVAALIWRLHWHAAGHGWLLAAAAFTGFLAADFTSGFVHWMADTWGSPDMPVIGKALVRPFREHHIDPLEITRHSFVETNGNNCLISIPAGIIGLLVPVGPGHSVGLFSSAAITSLILWVMATNQFHKWAHLPKPSGVVRGLQKLGLILSPEHHAIHHTAPYDRYYCITVGWLNWPLTTLRFFRIAETLVSAVSGLQPRADDLALAESAEEPAPLAPGRGA